MASGLITSWELDGETVETVSDFILGGSKITPDGDCSHEIKRRLFLGRKVMTNLDSILKSRDITLSTKVRLVKVMKLCAQLLSHVQLFVTPRIVCQAPLSMGFSRQEYFGGLPFPPPGDLLTQGSNPCLLNWQADSLSLSHLGIPGKITPLVI